MTTEELTDLDVYDLARVVSELLRDEMEDKFECGDLEYIERNQDLLNFYLSAKRLDF